MDCSREISREHFLTKNILEVIGPVPVSGLFWLKGETKTLGAQALAAKILCARHNSALSPLDSVAGDLFAALGAIDTALADEAAPAESREWALAGADIERWLLKVLLGMVHGHAVQQPRVRDEKQLVEVLFGEREWTPWWGLHFPARSPGTGTHYFKGMAIEALHHDDEVWGLNLSLSGLVLQLALGEANRDESAYHPQGVRFSYAGRPGTQTLTFAWPGRPYAQYLPLSREAPYGGEPIVYM